MSWLALACALGALDGGVGLDGGADAGARDAGQSAIPDPTWAQRLVNATTDAERAEQLLDDGTHVRFGTRTHGPVHVWRPRGYKPDKSDLILYLHGFYTDADAAMLDHQLARQFRDSGRSALFVVAEAPSWRTDPTYWEDLDELLAQVAEHGGAPMPSGKVTAVGHSGAYRTIASWLKSPRLDRVVLLDGLYAADNDFHAWLAGDEKKQLFLIGFDTTQRTGWFLQRYQDVGRLDEVPYLYDRLPPALAKQRLVFLSTHRFDHMGLVTEGRVLPWVLHVLP